MPSHETTETKVPAPEDKQYYTLEQANRMIPELELIFIRIQQMQIQVQSLFKMVPLTLKSNNFLLRNPNQFLIL